MPDARITASIDPQILARFDNIVENRSEAIEEFMRKKTDMEKAENEELVKRRESLQEKLEEKREQRDARENEIDNIETELNAIRSTLEKAEEEKDVLSDALPTLVDHYWELKRDRVNQDPFERMKTTEKFHMWLEKVDMDAKELLQEVKKEVGE